MHGSSSSEKCILLLLPTTVTFFSENSAAEKNSFELCIILRMENGAGTQKVTVTGKTVTHTESGFHIWKTSIIQHFRKNLNLPSQVSFCNPCLITWPLPHSTTSDSSNLPPLWPHTFSTALLFQPLPLPTTHTFWQTWQHVCISHLCITYTSHAASQFPHANFSTWFSPHSCCCNLLIWFSLWCSCHTRDLKQY